jgi:CheY-like chemotaxis protein
VSDRAISNELKDGTKNKITMAKKILIVDDEAHIRMLIEQTLEELEDEGVEFLTADNGATALDIIQSETLNWFFLT